MVRPPTKNSKLAALQPDKVKAVQSILSKKAARGKKADPFNTVSRPKESSGASIYLTVQHQEIKHPVKNGYDSNDEYQTVKRLQEPEYELEPSQEKGF